MDAFGDDDFNASNGSGVDPAAEFLAREHDQLAGLEDEVLTEGTGVANSSIQSNHDFTSDALEASQTNGENSSYHALDAFGSADVDHGFSNDVSVVSNGIGGGSNAPSGRDYSSIPREEPEKIKKWREEQKVRLEAKDEEEERKKKEMKEHARKELEDWYKHHKETIEKTRSANRNAEKELVSQPTELEPGQEWERIAKLCDFNPKAGRTSKDISRMRSIILQLKQTPPASSLTRN